MHEDRRLVRTWLSEPAIRTWWGSPAAVEAEIAIALESESAICRMIEVDGTAVGYAHAFDNGLMDMQENARCEPGIWQCTYFIGCAAYRGRGHGADGLALLADAVLSTTLAIGCETRVPVGIEAAIRAVEAKGFRWRRIESDPQFGPFWIMRRDRGG